MYTVFHHTFEYKRGSKRISERRVAVGLTSGPAAIDISNDYSFNGSSVAKAAREGFFPIKLLDIAVAFKCQDGNATVKADKTSILAEIGQDTFVLDDGVHGIVAASALHRVLAEGGPRKTQFIRAVHCGVERMSIDLPTSFTVLQRNTNLDTQTNLLLLLGRLENGPEVKYKELVLSTEVSVLSTGRSPKKAASYEQRQDGQAPTTWPAALWQITTLTALDLCAPVKELSSSIANLQSLTQLTLRECNQLEYLPEELKELSRLASLRIVRIHGCAELRTLSPCQKLLSCICLSQDSHKVVRKAEVHAIFQLPIETLMQFMPRLKAKLMDSCPQGCIGCHQPTP